MTKLAPQDAAVKPRDTIAYFDRVAAWLRRPADRAQLAALRRDCGNFYAENRAALFGQGFRQRLDLKQPRDAALAQLAQHDDALVNQLELAVDYTFATRADRDAEFDRLDRHLVRRWHRRQRVKAYAGASPTRYDGERRAANRIVVYAEDFARQTGELDCLHLEWRASGARAVRAAGVKSTADLLSFDHLGFWERRLLLYEIDPATLGRLLRNRRIKTRSRTSDTDDHRAGMVALNASRTEVGDVRMQDVIDRFGSSFPRRALVPVERAHLLYMQLNPNLDQNSLKTLHQNDKTARQTLPHVHSQPRMNPPRPRDQ